MQLAKKGKFITVSNQGSCHTSNTVVWGQRALSRDGYPNLSGMHKRLVAGLSRLVTCLQSNFIGTNFAGFCSNLGDRGLFSSPFVSYWVHIDWLAPGYLMGAGNPTISRETETQVRAACQPRQPHIPPCLCFYGRPDHGSFISPVGTVKY